MYFLKIKRHFDAAHKLTDYDGPCNRLHGHRWTIEVVVKGERLNDKNMLVDFKDLKALVEGCLPDHEYLNDVYMESNPTAEFLCGGLYSRFKRDINKHFGLSLHSVEVFESPECSVRYQEDK